MKKLESGWYKSTTSKNRQGILNRATQLFEADLWQVYEKKGGQAGLLQFANEYPALFYGFLMKRLPEVQGEGKGPSIQVHVYGKPEQVQAIDISAETAEEAKTVPEQQGGDCPD